VLLTACGGAAAALEEICETFRREFAFDPFLRRRFIFDPFLGIGAFGFPASAVTHFIFAGLNGF